MGFAEWEYKITLRIPMDTSQAYDKMLDIEMKNLWSPRCWVSRIMVDGNRILIKSNIAKIYAICTPQEIVFLCKLTGFRIMAVIYAFIIILFLAVTAGFIAEGVLLLAFIFLVLIGILIWTLLHQRDNTIKLVKQIIDVIYSYL